MSQAVTENDFAGPVLERRRLYIIIGALLLGMLLASLDQTVVSTALPTIAGDLHGLSDLSWVVTAYILAQTASTPLWGKLGDMYGRKIFFQAAIVIFLIGSVLSGLSTSMIELVAFRALQGIGGGGLMIGAQAIIGDIVAPRDRGRYQGLFGAVFGVTSVVGPLIGGFFVDNLSWRWVFYINLPLGAVALVITAIVLPQSGERIHQRIDYLGTTVLATAATSLVLFTTLGGSTYAWGSAPIIILAVAGVALIGVFIAVERRAAEPVMPLRLFTNRVFSASSAVGFVVGFAMFGAITYLPQYMQVVRGASPTGSGLELLPLMAGLLITSTASGILISRWGRYKVFPIVGTGVMIVGMYLLSRLAVGTSVLSSSVSMFVLGFGIGCVMQVLLIAVQNIVSYKDLGVATSGTTFFRSIGGSFGTAVFGAIFTNQQTSNLRHYLKGLTLPAGFNPKAGESPAQLHRLPPAVHNGYIHSFAASLHTVFLVAVPITAVAFALSWLLKEVPLRQAASAPDTSQTLAPNAVPAIRDSADETTRALSLLASRENKTRMFTALAQAASVDLDPRSTWLLMRLDSQRDLNLTQAGSRPHVDPDDVPGVLAPLVRAGYVTAPAPGTFVAHVTPSGHDAAERLVSARETTLTDFLGASFPDSDDRFNTNVRQLARDLLGDPNRREQLHKLQSGT